VPEFIARFFIFPKTEHMAASHTYRQYLAISTLFLIKRISVDKGIKFGLVPDDLAVIIN